MFHYQELELYSHPHVYNPAEDTYLLLEALTVSPTDVILEIGTGCGIIALALCRHCHSVVCTDINPVAVELTKKNIRVNSGKIPQTIEVRNGDLFTPLVSTEQFSKIIFNPPYLPTDPADHIDQWTELATSGGSDGLQTIEAFLRHAPSYLTADGQIFFVFSSLSKRTKLHHILGQISFHHKIVKSISFGDETLDVYCAYP